MPVSAARAAIVFLVMFGAKTGGAEAGVLTANTLADAVQEVPANDSGATGRAAFSFDNDSGNLRFDLVVAGITLTDITFPDGDGLAFGAAGPVHLHNAPAGANGPIVLPINNPVFYSETGDGFALRSFGPLARFLSGITAEAFLNQLALGNIYVNIHSFPVFPGGEIRGQLVVIPEPAGLVLLGFGLSLLVVAGALRTSSRRPPTPVPKLRQRTARFVRRLAARLYA